MVGRYGVTVTPGPRLALASFLWLRHIRLQVRHGFVRAPDFAAAGIASPAGIVLADGTTSFSPSAFRQNVAACAQSFAAGCSGWFWSSLVVGVGWLSVHGQRPVHRCVKCYVLDGILLHITPKSILLGR